MVEGKLPVDLRISCEPTGSRTLMLFRGHGQAIGPMRLAQPLLQRMLKRQSSRQCETLREVLARLR